MKQISQAQLPVPSEKRVVARRSPNQPWVIEFNEQVTRRDISHLLRLIRVAFLRKKRKERIRQMKQARKTRESHDERREYSTPNS